MSESRDNFILSAGEFTTSVERRLDNLEAFRASVSQLVGDHETRLDELEMVGPDPDPDPEPEPDPDPQPTTLGFQPLVPPLPGDHGAGNQPPRGDFAFVGERIVQHPDLVGKRVVAVHGKGKETTGYAEGTPRWDVEWHRAREGDGLFDGGTHLFDTPAFDARSVIDASGNWRIQFPTPRALPEVFWRVVKDVDGDSSFASVNFLRMAPTVNQRHVSNEWNAADAGKRTMWGLDPRSVVWHDDTYVSTPTFGWYGSSRTLIMLPTYVIEYEDGTFEGQPYYGGWGQSKPETQWDCPVAAPLTGIVASGGVSAITCTVYNASGGQIAQVTVQHGGGFRLTRLLNPINVPTGGKVRLRANSPAAFNSLAMDSAWHSLFGRKLYGYQPLGTGGYGQLPISPVSW